MSFLSYRSYIETVSWFSPKSVTSLVKVGLMNDPRTMEDALDKSTFK